VKWLFLATENTEYTERFFTKRKRGYLNKEKKREREKERKRINGEWRMVNGEW